MEQNKKTTSPLKPVTSIDVAREAKVSQATVSRVFSMHPNVSVETYNKVIQAANRLGYTPNAIARSFVSITKVSGFYHLIITMRLQCGAALAEKAAMGVFQFKYI